MKLFQFWFKRRYLGKAKVHRPAGTCQACGEGLKIQLTAQQPNVSCSACGAPSLVALGNQRLFTNMEAAYPISWNNVYPLLQQGVTMYWRFHDQL